MSLLIFISIIESDLFLSKMISLLQIFSTTSKKNNLLLLTLLTNLVLLLWPGKKDRRVHCTLYEGSHGFLAHSDIRVSPTEGFGISSCSDGATISPTKGILLKGQEAGRTNPTHVRISMSVPQKASVS